VRRLVAPLAHRIGLDGRNGDGTRGEQGRQVRQDAVPTGRTDPTVLELIQAEGVADRLTAGEADGVGHETLFGSQGACP